MVRQAPGLLNAKEIAEKTSASGNTIAKVMQRLVKARLVHSCRGPAGGFTLAHDPGDITLLHVYEVIEGTLEENSCPFHSDECIFGSCIFGDFIPAISREFKEKLAGATLADYL
jgi:Rrf2 family protein